jgi:hypothetical protein
MQKKFNKVYVPIYNASNIWVIRYTHTTNETDNHYKFCFIPLNKTITVKLDINYKQGFALFFIFLII